MFDYDKLVHLIVEKVSTFSSIAQYSIHTYDELNMLFNNDVPDALLKLRLSKKGFSDLQIKFICMTDGIQIHVNSTDQTNNLHNTKILKSWIETGGNKIKEDNGQVDLPSRIIYFNHIKVYKK